MENVVLGIVLSMLIIIPLALKWELELKPAILAGVAIGIFSGVAVHLLTLFLEMALAVRVIVAAALIVTAAFGLAALRFYRDPERTPPQVENCIVSPADGVIKYIKPIERNVLPLSSKGNEHVGLCPAFRGILSNGNGYLIGIGMNYLDVHVTRAPIKGNLVFCQHVAGSFLSLKKPEAVYANERLNEVIENGRYSVGIIHIASRLVNRIVSYVGNGDRLVLGQRIGMIRFGSQVDVVLPDPGNLEIKTRVREKVIGGETIIAVFREKS